MAPVAATMAAGAMAVVVWNPTQMTPTAGLIVIVIVIGIAEIGAGALIGAKRAARATIKGGATPIADAHDNAYSGGVRPRRAFTSLRIFLALMRRSTEPFVGRVGRRRFGATSALRISSARRSRAISRLRA